MKTVLACLMVFVIVLPLVFAEHEGEFGVLYGISHFFDSYDSDIQVINAPETLYFMSFVNDRLGIGPEVELVETSGGLDGIRSFGGRFTFFFQGHKRSTLYALGQTHIVVPILYTSDSDPRFAIGFGLGYQARVGSNFIFRGESRYRTILGASRGNISIAFGIGIKID